MGDAPKAERYENEENQQFADQKTMLVRAVNSIPKTLMTVFNAMNKTNQIQTGIPGSNDLIELAEITYSNDGTKM